MRIFRASCIAGVAVELPTPGNMNLEQCPACGGAEASYDARASHRIARNVYPSNALCVAWQKQARGDACPGHRIARILYIATRFP